MTTRAPETCDRRHTPRTRSRSPRARPRWRSPGPNDPRRANSPVRAHPAHSSQRQLLRPAHVVLDQKHHLAAIARDGFDEASRVIQRIRMRQTARHLRDAVVVSERGNDLDVRDGSACAASTARSQARTTADRAARAWGWACPAAWSGSVCDKSSCERKMKKEAGFPPPLGAFDAPPVQQVPADVMSSTVYSAATSVIGRTDTKVRPPAFTRNAT